MTFARQRSAARLQKNHDVSTGRDKDMTISAMQVGQWPFAAKWKGVAVVNDVSYITKAKYSTHKDAIAAAVDMSDFVFSLGSFCVDGEGKERALQDYGYERI